MSLTSPIDVDKAIEESSGSQVKRSRWTGWRVFAPQRFGSDLRGSSKQLVAGEERDLQLPGNIDCRDLHVVGTECGALCLGPDLELMDNLFFSRS